MPQHRNPLAVFHDRVLINTGQRHGFGNMNEYFFWLRADYFCEHLLGKAETDTDIKWLNNAKQMKK